MVKPQNSANRSSTSMTLSPPETETSTNERRAFVPLQTSATLAWSEANRLPLYTRTFAPYVFLNISRKLAIDIWKLTRILIICLHPHRCQYHDLQLWRLALRARCHLGWENPAAHLTPMSYTRPRIGKQRTKKSDTHNLTCGGPERQRMICTKFERHNTGGNLRLCESSCCR
jgi:hypothetical protein